MHRYELPYQCARPVIESHMAPDAGTFEPDLPAVSQSPVHVIVAGNKHCIFPAFLRIDDLFGILEILKCRRRTVFQNDLVCGIPLVTGIDLLEQYQHLGFNGGLYAYENDTDVPPSFDTLGVSGGLVWATEAGE